MGSYGDQHNELKILLSDWGLHALYDVFGASGFDRIEDLKILTEHELNSMFPGDHLRARKCRLRSKIADWRERNGFRITIPTLSIVYTQEIATKITIPEELSTCSIVTVKNETLDIDPSTTIIEPDAPQNNSTMFTSTNPNTNSSPIDTPQTPINIDLDVAEKTVTLRPRPIQDLVATPVIAPKTTQDNVFTPIQEPSINHPNLKIVSVESNKSDPEDIIVIKFHQFLETPDGQKILEMYHNETPNHLTDTARNLFMDNLLDFLTKNEEKILLKQFSIIAKAIADTFNFENEAFYYQDIDRPSGRFFNKYRVKAKHFVNKNRRRSKITEATTSKKLKLDSDLLWPVKQTPCTSKQVGKETTNKTDIDSFLSGVSLDYQNDKLWLSKNVKPWETIVEKWKKTSMSRHHEISQTLDEDPKKLFDKWPLYFASNGYSLVNIDFSMLFPNNQINIVDKWNQTSRFLHNTLSKKIKDKKSSLLLNDFPDDLDQQAFTILTSLHAVVKPAVKITNKSTNKIWRISIDESIQSFFMIVTKDKTYEKQMEKRIKLYQECDLFPKPIIVIENQIASMVKFYSVRYGDINYKFDSLLEAVDAFIKMKFVFNLSYPLECSKVCAFLHHFFYGISIPNYKLDSDSLALMQEMEIQLMKQSEM